MMKEKEILKNLKILSESQGSYKRLYDQLIYLKENNTYYYTNLMSMLEKNCNDIIDLIIYIES